MYFGASADIKDWSKEKSECTLVINENPLAEYVMLPVSLQNTLWYSNIICGVLKGALEMLNIVVTATFLKDKLRGNDSTEIRLVHVETIAD